MRFLKTKMKSEIRLLGIDDAPFDKFSDKKVIVVGVMYRGGNFLDGLMSTRVTVDGKDATDKLVKMINASKFKPQLNTIVLGGIAVGGFNIIDVFRLHKETGLSVLVVIRNYPDYKKIFDALTKIGMKNKIKIIKSLAEPVKIGNIWVQYAGMTLDKAKEIIKISTLHAQIPEPIRVAHIIAAGIVRGESYGRA